MTMSPGGFKRTVEHRTLVPAGLYTRK